MQAGATFAEWLARSAAGGGLVLLITWLAVRWTRQPARQQRLAEWGVVAALLLAGLSVLRPWVLVPVPPLEPSPMAVVAPPADERPPAPATASAAPGGEPAQPPAAPDPEPLEEGKAMAWLVPLSPDATSMKGLADRKPFPPGLVQPPSAVQAPATDAANEEHDLWPTALAALPTALGVGYVAIAALMLGRWLVGQWGLARLLRTAQPAPCWLEALLPDGAGRRPRLLVSSRVQVPISCGPVRPTIVLPRALCVQDRSGVLRFVLLHERSHLERHDARGALLFSLAQVVYFYVPWLWGLRRQVGLCQEFLADAAAASAGAAADYAQFLLSLTGAPAVPTGATGVSGQSSDLFRRITMLLRNAHPLDRRCPRLWSLAAASGLVSLAVVLAGVGLRADAAPQSRDDVKKEDVKKDDVKKDETKKDETKKDETKKEQEKKTKPAIADDALPENLDEIIRLLQVNPERGAEAMQRHAQRQQAQMRGMLGRGMQINNPFGHTPGEGRLGIQVSKPGATLVEQLDLPKSQGLVIDQVTPESAAAKAGIKPNDILLELNGKSVPDNPADLVKQVADLKADSKVDAVVLRKGKKETVKGLVVPEAKAAAHAGAGGNPNVNLDFNFPDIAVQGLNGPNFPALPQLAPGMLRPNGLPIPQANFAVGGANTKTVMTTTFRTDDRFTTRHQEGSLIITVTGKVADGKAKTNEIQVQDGRETTKYESVDKVPEQYRDKVKNLVQMSEMGSVRVEIKTDKGAQ